MKNRMMLLLIGSMPLVVAADTISENLGVTDAGTLAALMLGGVALFLARRMQKKH